MTHFDTSQLILFGMTEKMPVFKAWVSPVLMQNPGIWNGQVENADVSDIADIVDFFQLS